MSAGSGVGAPLGGRGGEVRSRGCIVDYDHNSEIPIQLSSKALATPSEFPTDET